MPKLNGFANGDVDKENDYVTYNDARHEYVGKKDHAKYTSVTTLIHNYTQPFDEDFWASYKACEFILGPEGFAAVKGELLRTKRWNNSYIPEEDIEAFKKKKAEIIQEYADKRNAACERGTEIHAIQENMFYAKDPKMKKYVGGGKFDVKKGYYKLDVDKAVFPEFLISYDFDEYLKIAGQIDFLVKDGNDIIIGDFKTNNEIKMTSYFDRATKKKQMMKFPLNDVEDCNFYHYSLQLSLYAYLLQKINPKFNIVKLMIVHFDHQGNEVEYECKYMKEEVARMLLHFRKEQKIKTQLELDKPIIF